MNEEERLARHMKGVPLKEEGHTRLHLPKDVEADHHADRKDSKPPVGAVGIVDPKDRDAMDRAEIDRHVLAHEKKHHILTEDEDARAKAEVEKHLALQERTRQRIEEAERNNPALKAKNPHIL